MMHHHTKFSHPGAQKVRTYAITHLKFKLNLYIFSKSCTSLNKLAYNMYLKRYTYSIKFSSH